MILLNVILYRKRHFRQGYSAVCRNACNRSAIQSRTFSKGLFPKPSGITDGNGPDPMIFAKPIKFICISVITLLLYAENALAWGPGVHTAIALTVLDDVRLILPAIAGVISSFPSEYVYGCLAADFFLGKRKMKMAGQAHNWKGGFRLLHEADSDQETAYAYGFLSHLAADVIAHNFFVPTMTHEYRALRKKSHLYWEIRADYLVGQKYTKIARNVLNMDHRSCDELLKVVSGRRKNGLDARKLLYTQSVRISDHAYTTHHLFFPDRLAAGRGFSEYTVSMIGLSSRVVKGFLKYPEMSPCLAHDPIGKRNPGLAKRARSFARRFRIHASLRSPISDGKFLER